MPAAVAPGLLDASMFAPATTAWCVVPLVTPPPVAALFADLAPWTLAWWVVPLVTPPPVFALLAEASTLAPATTAWCVVPLVTPPPVLALLAEASTFTPATTAWWVVPLVTPPAVFALLADLSLAACSCGPQPGAVWVCPWTPPCGGLGSVRPPAPHAQPGALAEFPWPTVSPFTLVAASWDALGAGGLPEFPWLPPPPGADVCAATCSPAFPLALAPWSPPPPPALAP